MQSSVELTWQPERARAAAHRPANLARSVFHFSSAAVALASVALLPSRGWLIAIAIAFAGYCWSMEIARRISPAFNDRLMRFYGPIAHAHERYRVNSATWYATALVVLAMFASKPASMAALAVLGVADPIAAMIGRRWGRRKLRAGRSLEGTLAFFASGTIAATIALALGGVAHAAPLLGFAALAGVTGALTELLSTRLDDNFTIPVVVGAIVTATSLFV